MQDDDLSYLQTVEIEFTWVRVMLHKCLDCVVASQAFHDVFPGSLCEVLPRIHSDHNLLLAKVYSNSPSAR